jgi:hypothetical protein
MVQIIYIFIVLSIIATAFFCLGSMFNNSRWEDMKDDY